MTTPKTKCNECGYIGEIYLELYPYKKRGWICEDCGSGKFCPRCKSKSIISNKGSTNLKPIDTIKWLCVRCLYEW